MPGELNGVILSGQSLKIAEQVNFEKMFGLYLVINLSVTNFHHNLLLTELENLGFTNQYQNHTPASLKKEVRQAHIYLRPLQMDLNMDTEDDFNSGESVAQVNARGPT